MAYVCVCVCVFSSHPFWTSSSLDVPAGVNSSAPAAFPAGVDPNRGSEETVRSRDQLKVQACCDQLKA